MIRKYKKDDLTEINLLLMKQFNNKYCMEIINEMKTYDTCLIYENERILGFAGAKIYDKNKNKHDLYIFVEPSYRNTGIGNLLYDKIMNYFNTIKPKTIRVSINNKWDQSIQFFKKREFKKWYGSVHMKYDLPKIENIDLNIVPFKEQYFDQYIDLSIDSFYEVRKISNIEPARIPKNNQFKDFKWQFRKNIYFILDGADMIGSYRIDGNHIEDLFVSPKYQGQGYGKKLTQSITNKILEKHDSAYLYVLDTNTKAMNTYKSVGYQVIEESSIYIKGEIKDS